MIILTTLLLPSKLAVPEPPPFFIPRSEVMAGLMAGLQGRITTLIAGSGYGKTMHLAWLVREASMSVAWLQLDEWDGSLTRFLTYLRQAVFASGPMKKQSARWVSPEEAVAEIALVARARGSLLLVIEDLHAPAGSDVAKFVVQLAQAAPPELHLFVSARPSLHLPLGRLRPTGQVHQIGQTDLRLNDAEAEALLHRAAGRSLPPAQTSRALALAGGWGAGLVLLGATIRRNPDWHLTRRELPGELSDYLREETWAALSREEQQLLEAAYLAKHMTIGLAQGMCGVGDWGPIMKRLHQGYGILDATTGGEYALSPLWEKFLQDRLLALGGEAGLQLRYREAAAVLKEQGRPFNAILLYLSARSFQEAAALISELAPVWMQVTSTFTLAEALDDLPGQVLKEYPWLALWAAQNAYARGRIEEARVYAGEASAGFARDHDRNGLVTAAALRCLHAIMTGEMVVARQLLDEGFAALEPGMDLLRARLLEQHWVLYRAEHPQEFETQERILHEALHLYRSAPLPQIEAEARLTDRLGFLALERGQLDQALLLLERSVNLLSQVGIPPWESGFNLGVALSTACRFAEARAIFEPMSQRSERPVRRLIGTLNLLDIHITLDDPIQAQEAARTSLELANQLKTPHLAARVRAELARFYRLQGEYGLAVTEARTAVAQAAKGADRTFERDARRALAEALLWSRSGSDGAPEYREVPPGTPEWTRTLAIAGIYRLRSRNRKDRDEGAELLRQALRDLTQQRSFRSFVLRHWDLALTLAVVSLAARVFPTASQEIITALEALPESVRQRGIHLPEPEARHLREAVNLVDDQGAALLEQLIPPHQRRQVQKAGSPPLRVRLLGRFDLRLNGEPLAAKELNWRRSMPLLLTLFVMPEGVKREALLDWLWPDASRSSGQNQLRVSLHHLRQLLEPERPAGAPSAFLISDAGTLSWIAENTRVDVWDVQNGLTMAARALRRGDAPAAALAYEKAVSRYRGALVTDGCPWLEGPREHLHRQMLQALSWLAEYHQYDRVDRAIAYLYRLLELDPGEERAVRHLITLLSQANRRGEVAQVYRRCQDYLEKELGVSVSPETMAVFREAAWGENQALDGK